jgi:hypothetical protein
VNLGIDKSLIDLENLDQSALAMKYAGSPSVGNSEPLLDEAMHYIKQRIGYYNKKLLVKFKLNILIEEMAAMNPVV